MCHIFVIACLYSQTTNALLYRFLHLVVWGGGMLMGQEGEKPRVFKSKADFMSKAGCNPSKFLTISLAIHYVLTHTPIFLEVSGLKEF